MSETLTIGKIAKKAGVNIQTLRFYERYGILKPAGREDSGYRFYSMEDVKKVAFIKNAQALGFTLKEVAGLMALRVRQKAKCGEVRKKAEGKLKDVRSKIKGLQSIEKTLQKLMRTCLREGTTNECPILDCLEDRNGKHCLEHCDC